MTTTARLLPLFACIALFGCAASYGLPKSDVEAFTSELCTCVQDSFPQFSEATWEFLEYIADEDDEEKVEAKLEDIAEDLSPEELKIHQEAMDFILNEFEYDYYTTTCGEPLLEKYPDFENLTDEDLTDLLLRYSKGEDCRALNWATRIYVKHDM